MGRVYDVQTFLKGRCLHPIMTGTTTEREKIPLPER
jgi:hypothetical protein